MPLPRFLGAAAIKELFGPRPSVGPGEVIPIAAGRCTEPEAESAPADARQALTDAKARRAAARAAAIEAAAGLERVRNLIDVARTAHQEHKVAAERLAEHTRVWAASGAGAPLDDAALVAAERAAATAAAVAEVRAAAAASGGLDAAAARLEQAQRDAEAAEGAVQAAAATVFYAEIVAPAMDERDALLAQVRELEATVIFPARISSRFALTHPAGGFRCEAFRRRFQRTVRPEDDPWRQPAGSNDPLAGVDLMGAQAIGAALRALCEDE